MSRLAQPGTDRDRQFGVSVGTVLLLIAAFLVWRGRIPGAEIAGAIGAVLVAAGYFRPRLLKYPSAAWWKIAHVLGWVNARVILTIIFALVLVPLSLIWRAIGRDPLGRQRPSWTGWTPYPARYRNHKHFERMF